MNSTLMAVRWVFVRTRRLDSVGLSRFDEILSIMNAFRYIYVGWGDVGVVVGVMVGVMLFGVVMVGLCS